nr:hypothetical protein [uncultured Marinifilum sp.]
MVIKEIELVNFQCYFGTKVFSFTKGLNIILGANAHGKSKLFDGINWLLNGNVVDIENLISEKAKATKSNFEVAVRLTCEQNGINYCIERYFDVDIIGNKTECSHPKCLGYVDNEDGSRDTVDGEELLDSLFPPVLRKYSLFKGERELNVFDPTSNKDALLNLVNALSDFRTLDAYVEIAKEAYLRHNKVLDSKARKNKNEQRKYDRLVKDRDHYQFQIKKFSDANKAFNEDLFQIRKRREDNLAFIETGPQLEKVNSKIFNQEKERSQYQYNLSTKTNFTVDLFDEKWLLMSFNEIQDAFDKKVGSLSKKKRRLTKEFDEKQGAIKGKKQLIEDLTKTQTPLPVGTPSKEIMEEMLEEEICKVCNREAPKGSEAYEYMQKRLKEFLQHIQPELEEVEEEQAFKNEFIEELRALSLEMTKKRSKTSDETIQKEINETYELIDLLRTRIHEKDIAINDLEKEREKILSKSTAGEETILEAANSIRQYDYEIPRIEAKVFQNREKVKNFEEELRKTQEAIDKINFEEGLQSENLKTLILRDLKIITQEVKEEIFDDFINDLETKSNHYYRKFGEASSGFTGQIKIHRISDTNNIQIKTIDNSSDRDITHTLSSSTLTSVNISILMAISDLSIKNSGQALPMIFDAPTSEFDLLKSIEFYKLCRENFEQSIIMTKDFLEDLGDRKFLVGENFKKISKDKAFWVKLDESINPEEMQSVESQIINL